MAIIAKAEMTVSHMIDVVGTYRYYLLQSSTASAPSKPTTYPPSSSWDDTEPSYTSGSTNSLYVVDCSVYSNGTFYYSPVSLSTAYEAAKEAYNKAVNAQSTADAAKELGIEYIVGTQTAVTNAWTGKTNDAALKTGKTIAYKLPYAGNSSAATLNLTLSGGGTTGAKEIRRLNSTVTTNYVAGSVVHMTYDGTYWRITDYNSDTYDRIRYNKAIKCGTTAIVAANIIVGTGGLYKHLKAGTAFDISYPILYAGSAIAASATGTNNYTCISFTVTTTQSITLTAYKPVYIKGKLAGTTFTPVSTAPLTQTIPTSNDGYYYILLGHAITSTTMYLMPEHPIYTYFNGAFKAVSQIAVEAAKTATNYMDFGGSYGAGLVIGDLTASVLGRNIHLASDRIDLRNGTGTVLATYQASLIQLGQSSAKNVLLNTDGLSIRNGSIVLAQFGTDTIYLGKENNSAVIDLCGGAGEIYASQSDSGFFDQINMLSNNVYLRGGDIRLDTSTQYDDSSQNYSESAHGSVSVLSTQSDSENWSSGSIRVAHESTGHVAGITTYTSGEKPYVQLYTETSETISEIYLTPDTFEINYVDDISLNSNVTVTVSFWADCEAHFTDVTNLYGHLYFCENNLTMYATDPDGNTRTIFQPLNSGGNTVLGYGNYSGSSGSTNIYGNDVNLYSKNVINANQSIYITGSLKASESVLSGNKTALNDGLQGCILGSTGRLYLQGVDNSPGVYFYGNGQTSSGADISYTVSNDYLNFGGATRFVFGSRIDITGALYTSSGILIGKNDTADSMSNRALQAFWKDGSYHNIAERNADGLTSAFGWAGSSSYATVTKIRGRTCQYQNSSGTTTLSDERLKKDFTAMDKWDAFFDSLEPLAFRMKNGNSGRFHMGFKAQQVEQALLDNGLTTQDFAGFIRMAYLPDEDDSESCELYKEAGINPGDDELGLVYTEFTAINTYQIQQLKKKNEQQEADIENLKNEVKALRELLLS